MSEPEKIGKENALSEKEIYEIAQIIPAELNFFADSLFWKRLREVEKLLPLTRDVLANDFERYFRQFSQIYQPISVKKHLQDAIEFAKFLSEKKIEKGWIKDLAKFEQAKLEFYGLGKNFVFRVFDFDIRDLNSASLLLRNFQVKGRKTLAVWVRLGKRVKHFII